MSTIHVIPDEKLGEVLEILQADVIMSQSAFDRLCELTGKRADLVHEEIYLMDYNFGGEADHMIDVVLSEDHYFFTEATSFIGFE